MKTVEFKVRFSTHEKGFIYDSIPYNANLSGRYVPAEVAERLLSAAKKIEENWATSGWGYNQELRDKLKAAIKQAEEE